MYRISVHDYDRKKVAILKARSDRYIDGETFNEFLIEDKNGQSELTMVLPLQETIDGVIEDNYRKAFVVPEYFVKLEETGERDKWFKIIEPEEQDNNGEYVLSIKCTSIAYDLGNKRVEYIPDEDGTAEQLITKVLEFTNWSVGNVDSFGGLTKTLKSTSASNALDLLKQIANMFDAYFDWDTDLQQVNLYSNSNVTDTQILFKPKKNIKNLATQSNSEDIITKLYVTGGQTSTGIVGIQSANPTGEPYIMDFSYYINTGLSATKQALITQFYIDITQVNSDLSSAQSDINSTQILVSNATVLLNSKTILRNAKQEEVDRLNSKIAIESNATQKATDTSTRNTLVSEISILDGEIVTLTANLASYNAQLLAEESIYNGYVDDKNAFLEAFHSSAGLGDFIRAGNYSNVNLVNPTSLFNDGVSVLATMTTPKVIYVLDIADLSELDGYENEKIKLNNKIDVLHNDLGIRTKVSITKISRSLENPLDVTIEIANVYNNFVETYKKMLRNVSILNQQQAYWDRSQFSVNPDGTINSSSLQGSFDAETFNLTYGTNASAKQTDEGNIYTSVNNTDNMVKIDGDGIYTSNDGGINWKEALSSNGANIQNVYGNVLDVTQVYLKGDTYFFWTGDGLFAFDENDGDNDPNTANKFIKFNKDGLFFTLDGGTSYEISLDWSGLRIGLDGQSVVISSANGIQVFDGSSNERLKLGDLGSNQFGFYTKNATGDIKTIIQDDGTVRAIGGTIIAGEFRNENASGILIIEEVAGNLADFKFMVDTMTDPLIAFENQVTELVIKSFGTNIISYSDVGGYGTLEGTWRYAGSEIASESWVISQGYITGVTGASGSFTSADGKSITVSSGRVTSIS